MISFGHFHAGGPAELLANLRPHGHGERAFREGRANMTSRNMGRLGALARRAPRRALDQHSFFDPAAAAASRADRAAYAVGQSVWAFPLAGVVVGLIGALVYALAHRLGLPPWPAAALAVAATLGRRPVACMRTGSPTPRTASAAAIRPSASSTSCATAASAPTASARSRFRCSFAPARWRASPSRGWWRRP